MIFLHHISSKLLCDTIITCFLITRHGNLLIQKLRTQLGKGNAHEQNLKIKRSKKTNAEFSNSEFPTQ